MSTTAPQSVDTSISPSVHPEVIDAMQDAFILGVGADGSPTMHDAFTKARATMEAVFTKSTALAEAERTTAQAAAQGRAEPAHERRLKANAERTLGDTRKAVESTLEGIAAHRAQVESSIVDSLGINAARLQVTDSQRASDVRATLRAMSKADRLSALRNAIQEGDVEAVGAVLSASPLASGLSRGELDGLRMDAERRFTPEASALRDNLDKLRQLVAHAGDLTQRRFGRLAGMGDSPSARAERALSALEEGGNA